MNFGRGDISIASDNTSAILTGGFSGANNWCEPYNDTEQYNFISDTWIEINDMNIPRGDKALVVLNNNYYAIGGERSITNLCDLLDAGNEVGPEQKRISIDDVETYNIISKKWIILEELPYYRFRFPAVAYDELEKIYAFGGQVGFNTTCNCFATTNEITIFTEKFGTLPITGTNDSETETKPTSNNNTTTNTTKPTSTSSSFLITFFNVISMISFVTILLLN